MRKNERFKLAMEGSGLIGQIEADFKGWGVFHIDNADLCQWAGAVEGIDPALIAVTWMNESTFRYTVEPNRNGTDEFANFDVGPMQLNVKTIRANVANRFLNVRGIDVVRALGTPTLPFFDGDVVENVRLAARFLARIGRGTIVGPSQTVLYPSVADHWDDVPELERNERRAVAYTGPEARPARYRSWIKYAPLFETFFRLYADV